MRLATILVRCRFITNLILHRSIGVLPPGGSEGCKILQSLSLQLATPMLLLGADIRAAVSRCGPLLFAFIIAASSTLAAGTIAIFSTSSMLVDALGVNDAFKIAAALLAKNIGTFEISCLVPTTC